MNNKSDIISKFLELDFTIEEAKVYIELLQGPSSHLQLSKATGVNRTKVYRIIQELEQRSLVGRHTDDRGTFLVASDPSALEVLLVTKQQRLNNQREIVTGLVPSLNLLQTKSNSAFIVRHYEGYAGLKQMCWHELKAKGEIVTLGNGTIEQQVGDKRWADSHRSRQIAAGYSNRELLNRTYATDELPELASEKLLESNLYSWRTISPDIITFDSQTVVYNDTVSIYHWKHDQKLGIEIISPTYASMVRQIFEQYWSLASSPSV